MDAMARSDGGGAAPARSAPSPEAARRTRRAGGIAGGLLAAGVALAVPGAAFAIMAIAFASEGLFGRPSPLDPTVFAPLAIGAPLLGAGWAIGVRALRRAGAARPQVATALGTALATGAALAVVAVMVACWFALESLGIAPTEWLLVGCGGAFALAAGVLAGRAWWPRAAARALSRPDAPFA